MLSEGVVDSFELGRMSLDGACTVGCMLTYIQALLCQNLVLVRMYSCRKQATIAAACLAAHSEAQSHTDHHQAVEIYLLTAWLGDGDAQVRS